MLITLGIIINIGKLKSTLSDLTSCGQDDLVLLIQNSKKRIWIFIDNHSQGYKLSNCGSFDIFFFIFIQVDFGHAV